MSKLTMEKVHDDIGAGTLELHMHHMTLAIDQFYDAQSYTGMATTINGFEYHSYWNMIKPLKGRNKNYHAHLKSIINVLSKKKIT